MDLFYIFCLVLCICLTDVDSLMFHLSPNRKRCLKEEIHKDVLVTGEFELSDAPGQRTNLAVRTTDMLTYKELLYDIDSLHSSTLAQL